jgi:predicted DCC family thiol-disulfide oxidoreductase YuxK
MTGHFFVYTFLLRQKLVKQMEDDMAGKYPLIVFFDASCGLCNGEMQMIKLHDTKQRLFLIDCSAGDFEDAPYLAEGVSQAAMMKCLHVRNGDGE